MESIPFTEVEDGSRITPGHYLAARSDGLTFAACLRECSKTPELIAQVDRLYGTNLMRQGAPIELMIDNATGRCDADMQTFMQFVWNSVFLRCPALS